MDIEWRQNYFIIQKQTEYSKTDQEQKLIEANQKPTWLTFIRGQKKDRRRPEEHWT